MVDERTFIQETLGKLYRQIAEYVNEGLIPENEVKRISEHSQQFCSGLWMDVLLGKILEENVPLVILSYARGLPIVIVMSIAHREGRIDVETMRAAQTAWVKLSRNTNGKLIPARITKPTREGTFTVYWSSTERKLVEMAFYPGMTNVPVSVRGEDLKWRYAEWDLADTIPNLLLKELEEFQDDGTI